MSKHKKSVPPKNAISKSSSQMQMYFLFVSAIMLIASLGVALMSEGHSFSLGLYGTGFYSDQFMDFMNSVRDSVQPNLYNSRYSLYPPLAILFFRFIASLLSENVINTPFNSRMFLLKDQRSVLIYIIYILICFIAIDRMINSKIKNDRLPIESRLISVMLIFSFPMLYCLDRGNIVLLCVVTTMFFVFFRNSESKVIREIAYISLAVSAGLKFYPAIFGLLLIRDKKIKDALRLMLYGVLFIAVPFLIVHHMDTMTISNMSSDELATAQAAATDTFSAAAATQTQSLAFTLEGIIRNLKNFFIKKTGGLDFSNMGIQNVFYLPFVRKALGETTVEKLATSAFYTTEILALLAFIISKKEWQRVFCLTYFMLNIPAASSMYALSFMIIPFTLFLADNGQRDKYEWVQLFLFTPLLSNIPVFYYKKLQNVLDYLSSKGINNELHPNKLSGFAFFQLLFFAVVIPIFAKFILSIFSKIRLKKAVQP